MYFVFVFLVIEHQPIKEHSPTADGIIAFDFTDQFSEGDIGTFEVKKLNGPAYDIEVKITDIRKKGMNGVFKPDVVVSFSANQYYTTLKGQICRL